MRTLAVVPLVAVSVWAAGSLTPARGGTAKTTPGRDSQPGTTALLISPTTVGPSGLSSTFDPRSGAYVFETIDSNLTAGYDSGCSGSHQTPLAEPPCDLDHSLSGAAVTLNSFAEVLSCPDGRPQPLGRPSGGTISKRRHDTPDGQSQCAPARPIQGPSNSGSVLTSALAQSLGGASSVGGWDPDGARPVGGGISKRRHSAALTGLPGDHQALPSATPEPGTLALLGSGILILAAAARRRRLRQGTVHN